MRPFILIGAGQFAEYVRYLLENVLDEKVAAFAVDKVYQYGDQQVKDGLPIVTYENIQDAYPPTKYCVAIAFLGNDMFCSREKTFRECISWGYQVPNIVHPSVINQ